jgi:hypothetical protein
MYRTIHWNIDTKCKFRGEIGRVCHQFSLHEHLLTDYNEKEQREYCFKKNEK